MDRYRLKHDDLTGDIDLVVCKDGELIKYVDYHVFDERVKKELEDAYAESCKYFDCSYREAIKGE